MERVHRDPPVHPDTSEAQDAAEAAQRGDREHGRHGVGELGAALGPAGGGARPSLPAVRRLRGHERCVRTFPARPRIGAETPLLRFVQERRLRHGLRPGSAGVDREGAGVLRRAPHRHLGEQHGGHAPVQAARPPLRPNGARNTRRTACRGTDVFRPQGCADADLQRLASVLWGVWALFDVRTAM